MNEINEKLIAKAKKMGIDVVFTDMERNAFYLASEKTLFINQKFINECEGAYCLSHELAHAIKEHNSFKSLYNATASSRGKMEREANKIAIELLIELYVDDTGLEKEQINAINFMEIFNISGYLEKYVIEGMKECCV